MAQNNKLKPSKRFSQNAFSALALILVTLAEGLLWWQARKMAWKSFWTIAIAALALLFILWIVARICGHKFTPRSEIVTKLLANAVSPQIPGVWYLLSFVVHIGWLADSIMYLYLHFQFELPIVYASIAVCVAGLAVLIVFFPDGHVKKDDNATKVFVSGISNLFKPSEREKFTLLPLVRVLQEVKDGNCELLVLYSDFNHIGEDKVKLGIQGVLEYIGYTESIDHLTLSQQIEFVIRETAKREFPEKITMIQKMPINITEPCNYNVFSQCYATLRPWIKRFDDDSHQLAFNLSPGTGVVSSLMTLMAIHAGRDLYYYSQDSSLKDEDRLVTVDKTRVPLHNLLSQALENIKQDD
jgi:hypothetical protein